MRRIEAAQVRGRVGGRTLRRVLFRAESWPRLPAALLPWLALAACSGQGGAPGIPAASCSYADVSAAIARAAPGATVRVPAGRCAWEATLELGIGISLIGDGVGRTIITNAVADHGYLIAYQPTDYERNDPVRISGFTFDLGNNGPGILWGTRGKEAPFTVQTRARIDHNRFQNAADAGYQAIWNNGDVRGVVDSNEFDAVAYPIRSDAGTGDADWWDSFGALELGTAEDNLCFEDNVFTNVTAGIISDCQFSGRYLFRYNTISIPADPHGSYPLFDMHGSAPPQMWSCFGGELYGNRVVEADPYGATLLDQRGGKALVFGNLVVAHDGASIKVRDEYADSATPTTGGTQHVNDSYYWNNWVQRTSLERIAAYISQDCCDCDPACVVGTTADPACCYNPPDGLRENVDFFQDGAPFTGAAGVGCGPAAERPAGCVPGVAYWATTQPCGAPDETSVGAGAREPLAGTLYKCTAPDTWTAWYTPLPYPHPLRAELGDG
ncbi:MAG: hypothetical protein JXB32_19795 [Deltaproteobacteria bacterium]|nr:hypothetical protein [Deltaproteobacteria bacterium]